MPVQPLIEPMIGLESQDLLKNREAQDFPIVHFGPRPPARHEFAVLGPDSGLGKGIVQGRVDGRHDVFQIHKRSRFRHGTFLQKSEPIPCIDRFHSNLEHFQGVTKSKTGARHNIIKDETILHIDHIEIP